MVAEMEAYLAGAMFSAVGIVILGMAFGMLYFEMKSYTDRQIRGVKKEMREYTRNQVRKND